MSLTNNYRDLFFQLCKWNYLEDAKKIYNKERYVNEIPLIYREEIFQYACANGHLTLAQWILLEVEPDLDVFKYDECCFRWSCTNGHLKIAQWLYYLQPTPSITDELFYCTCGEGRIEVAEWLLEVKPTIDISGLDYRFTIACGHGHLPMVKWLYSKFEPSNSVVQESFEWACENGDIEMVEYLWSKENTHVIITDQLFQAVCELGRLEMAQWLLSKHPTIDLSANQDSAFRDACACGHLEVAQWLLEIKPTLQIDVLDNYAFREACKMRKTFVAIWLTTICPRYKIVKINANHHIYYKIYPPLSNRTYICEGPALQCPICYEKECNVRTQCQHSYCIDCISKWSRQCPMCREPIIQLHNLMYYKDPII
jgi:ankyrin repeat protein